MPAARFLISAWLCLLAWVATPTALTAQGEHGQGEHATGAPSATTHEDPGHQDPAAHSDADHGGHGAELHTMEMSIADIFAHQFSHSVPYKIFTPQISPDESVNNWFAIYNVQPWQWVGLVLLALVFLPVLGSFKSGRAGRVTRIFRGFCLWVRDDLVYSVMGKEIGREFVPFFMFVFFFIMAQIVIGLLPSIPALGHDFPWAVYTATGTPYVTGALAIITLVLMLGLGMKHNGVFGFFKGLIPHGVPPALLPILVPIELAGLIIKPAALTIRLFANMLAGHLVIASAIGLIFAFTKLLGGSAGAYLTAIPCAGMAVFIFIIESFVTLLQAYIFTLLSVTFIYQSIHQEH
ncbi:MAG: F0F1 ATP synthase subunit A [Planctomycetes bacterium]|nr:F0F1 ATP synthase subunit A [Planctomycetota bacterium]